MVERDYILLGSMTLSGSLHFLTMIFGFLSYTTEGGLFNNLSGNVTTKYLIQFSPHNWVFLLWTTLIFLWITLIFIYLGVNVFRSNRDGKFYCNPALMSTPIFGIMSISFILHLTWLFLWDNEFLVGTTLVLFLLSLSNWTVAILFSMRLLEATEFLSHHARIDLWIYRFLIQNGLATYAIWITLEFFIKFGVALAWSPVSQKIEIHDYAPIPSAVSAIFITFFIAIIFPMEMILWERYFRYMTTPLFVTLWTVSCIYARLNQVPHQDETMRIYSLTLIVILTLLFIGRNSYMVLRHFLSPIAKHV